MNLSSLQTSASGVAKTLATAAVALAATAPLMTAQATVVYSPLSTVLASNGAAVNLGFVPFSLAATVGSKGDAGFNFSGIPSNYTIAAATTTSVANFVNAGSTLNGSAGFTESPTVRIHYQTLQPGATFYFGLSFFVPNGGPRDFAWVSFTYDAVNNVRLTGWAYDDVGAAVTVGAIPAPVPEPSVPLLMAAGLGVMGLVYRRRGNRSAA